MVFEEFAGQIQLQKMLKFLDPYPMALEVKGGMRPAMYETVIITSNTRPDGWYKDEEAGGKRTDALLHSGTGLASRTGNNTICRTCGTYLEPALYGAITKPWLDHTRNWFMQQLAGACGIAAHDVLSTRPSPTATLIDVRAGNTAPALMRQLGPRNDMMNWSYDVMLGPIAAHSPTWVTMSR